MASSSGNNNGSSLFKSEKPHFFKVILAHSLTQHKLGLPPKFVRNHGDFLSTSVKLKVPSGVKWNVEIVKSEDEIWLQNGWPEFAEYYSVLEGFFLVFEYEKSDSEFNVLVFDKTATEIDYPFTLTNIGDHLDEEQVPKEPNVVVDEQETDVSVEILPSSVNLDEQFQNLQTCAATFNQNVQAREPIRRRKKLTNAEKAKAVELALSNFRSENPSFRIVIQPSYIDQTNVFEIPSSFARKYLNNNGDAVLNILDGGSWSIKYFSSTSSGKTITRFNNSAWYKFVKDNDIRVGDVCIFEILLEYIDEITFRVTIFKYSNLCTLSGTSNQSKENASCSKQPKLSSDCPKRRRVPGTCNISNVNGTRKKIKLQSSVRSLNRDCPKGQVEGRENIKARSNFSFENLIFKTAMQASNFDNNKYFLRVPKNFIKNMEQGSHKLKLQVDNKLWSVKLNIYPHFGILGKGWIEFARQNSLEVGDVCTFELIDKEILLIRVSISRD